MITHIIPPLTEEEMEIRQRQANHALSAQMMSCLLEDPDLRCDVRDLLERAFIIHSLNTP